MNLITVIIPMYNEEKNVEKCISTLINQTNHNFDVIFIDDGSTDQTLTKLKGLLQKQIKLNYKVLTQTNRGAAAARELGVTQSVTEYIMFYDCDDSLSDNMIEAFYENHHTYLNADIIIPRMSIQNEDGKWNELKFFSDEKLLDPLDCVKYSLNGWKVHGCFALKKNIFIKSYSDYKKFNPSGQNYINNDEIVTRLNFRNSEVIVRSNAIYYYWFNQLSTTKRINEKTYLKIKNAIILDQIFSYDCNLRKHTKAELISTLWGVSNYKNQHIKVLVNATEWDRLLKQSIEDICYFKNIIRLPLKQKVQISLLKIKLGLNLL